MSRWIKNILAIVILVFLIWYIYEHWDRFKALSQMRMTDVVLLYLLTALGTVNNSRITQKLIGAFSVRISFLEIMLLQNATRLLNYVPMKFGTFFRLNYLKTKHGFRYVDSMAVLAHQVLLTALMAGMVGMAGVLAAYQLTGYDAFILVALFAFLIIGALFFILIPLPTPTASGRINGIVRNFIAGRKSISGNLRITFLCLVHLLLTFLLTSLRFWVIYNRLGCDVNFFGYLVLGAVGFGSTILSITPGALGIRELLLGVASTVVGLPLEVGVLAAVFDRAIMLSWTFVVGSGCAVWFWYKYPADFKVTENQQPLDTPDLQ